ncbi:polyketide synthase [Penicillium pulvis]|uniref:polyketide synthase n=1 Tax=Penicillium pulvis TaxID=1562058 RepID=UPI002548F04D|nr:polyketide synthase [Penicillium pulvis]KAJ5784444.1 polyketide synthase [Penicillium pulvis]
MPEQNQVILFGDLTCNYLSGLRSLVAIKNNPLLTTFFERVTFCLREEIGTLPMNERTRFPRFITFQELLAGSQGLPYLPQALETTLASTYQLACFINHFTAPEISYPNPQNTWVVGLCTGLLSAAAVSCSKTVTDLIPLAAHTVLVAFRVGLCVSEVLHGIAPQVGKDPAASWATLIPGLETDVATLALKHYNNDKGLPATSSIYISTYANASLTLSGPPENLLELISGKYLPGQRSIKLPIHAPYHAAALYQQRDVDMILRPTLQSGFDSFRRHSHMISSVNGEVITASNFGETLKGSINEILREPLRLDRIVDSLAQTLGNAEQSCRILPIATLTGQSIAAGIQKQGQTEVTMDPAMNFSSAVSDDGASGKLGDSRLAIIGYSGRFPDAKNTDEFWKLLQDGRDVASTTPSNRWDVRTHVDPTLTKKNTMATPYGCWLQQPGLFDANFFMISPREAPQMDPAQRLSLMTAYEAMEYAGFVPDSTPSTQSERIGVFYGTTSNDWGEINSSQDVDTYYIPGSCRAFIPGRQNFFYKFGGPSYSIDTACSSSLASLHLACNSLLKGDIDTAFCGGTNVLTNPDISAGLDRGHFLSRTGNCKTFDDDADGYCRGEGVCTLIIKRLEDAKADNDPICAIIRGAYTNHSAEAESITRPHIGAQKAIFEKVLSCAAVDPYSVGYIEMHGTGTQAGDAREMKSVLSVFAPSEAKARTEEQKLFLGSVKANVGHGESVSGVIALIKSIMMMEKNEIPPHCGIKTKINSGFPTDMEERNIHIAKSPTPWTRPERGVRRVMINNFSAAGGNSSVLIEDKPASLDKDSTSTIDPRSTHVVAVSAKSSTALLANINSVLAHLKDKKPPLASLSYTTTARRMHNPFRVMVAGSHLEEIAASLGSKLTSPVVQRKARALQPVAFAFTGQGSQYIGMGRHLLHFSSFCTDMHRFDALSQALGFPSILPLVQQAEGDITQMSPVVVQVATTCTQMAMAKLWQSWGVQPRTVVGHSLGEYAALNVAGVLSEADTIFLVGKRAQLIEEHIPLNTHAMLAVSTSVKYINIICEGLEYEIACINSPSETVLSGTTGQMEQVLDRLSARENTELRKTKLQVPFAFHSSQMQPILDMFQAATRAVKFNEPKVSVISPLLGEVLTSKESFGTEYLARHCRETVNLAAGLLQAKNSAVNESTIWVEIGAHPIVSGLLRNNLGPKTTTLPTLQRNKDTWKTISASLTSLYESGVEIRWGEYHRDFAHSLSVLRLPSYNWDLKNYWIQYANDWTLHKGEPRSLQATRGLSTTCIHKLVEEKDDGNTVLVVGETDVLREDMDCFVRGHCVNNVPLVTPSIYAEMALVIGEHLRKQQPKLDESLVDLQNMDVQRPFVTKTKGTGPQLLRCHVSLDRKTFKAAIEFWSVTSEGKRMTKHAEAGMAFPNAMQAHAEAQLQAVPVLEQMKSVSDRLYTDERVQKLSGKTGYQLVSSLAQYDSQFMGVSSVLLDSRNREAVAIVQFENPQSTNGIYYVNPHLIDNLGQPALFIMNANDEADLSKEVFVNHGWASLHFYKPMSMTAIYRTHVQMTGPSEDGMYHGNVFVFENNELAALYKGVKAQGVPRRLMDYIVHMRDETKTGSPAGGTLHTRTQASSHSKDASTGSVTSIVSASVTTDGGNHTDSWSAALKIISEESGVPIVELVPSAELADLGLDSLLALLCASRFREELGLAHESSIFMDYPTMEALEKFWKQDSHTGSSDANKTLGGNDAILNSMFTDNVESDPIPLSCEESSSKSDSSSTKESSGVTTPEYGLPPPKLLSATSLLLQGNPVLPSTAKTLFLLPDGSGSCSSYAAIPRIHPSVAVVGVNCPFMKAPESYNCGIEKVSELYIREIRRRRPHGPYALGGWSVGGIFAYHVAQQLASAGETVTDLILIDCPVPRGLDHLPSRYYEYCDEIGLLGTVNGVKKEVPKWLIPHFEACVNSLHEYHATPFAPVVDAPKTQIIWACDAIDKHLEPKFEARSDDPEGLKFLTEERADFGPAGWDYLLPMTSIALSRIDGANHFSMIQGDHAKRLGEEIQGFLMST